MIYDSQALNGGDYQQLLSCVVHLSLETLILEEIPYDPPLAFKIWSLENLPVWNLLVHEILGRISQLNHFETRLQ